MAENPFKDIPGTILFDAEQSRLGYHLNMFCMSLMKAANRETFKADERGFLDRFPMTEAQKQSVLDRDWNGMLALGGNIYFTAKLGACDGLSFQQLAGVMTGMGQPKYAQMMLDGGRAIEGNRSKRDKR
jgi:protocatechuate 4,5-dioxygenase alpha chain